MDVHSAVSMYHCAYTLEINITTVLLFLKHGPALVDSIFEPVPLVGRRGSLHIA